MSARPHDTHVCSAEGCDNQATHVYENDVMIHASLVENPNGEAWGPLVVHHTDHVLVCDQHLPTSTPTRGPEPVQPCAHCGRWSASWRMLPEPCPLCGKLGCMGCVNAHHAGEPEVRETVWPEISFINADIVTDAKGNKVIVPHGTESPIQDAPFVRNANEVA